MFDEIKKQIESAVTELTSAANLGEHDILVVGCSTSEILGEKIGTYSKIHTDVTMELAEQLWLGLKKIADEKKIRLAFQCCEHLNRALIVEKQTALEKGLEIVMVVPQPSAGGSLASVAYREMKEPVAVEQIQAEAGIDIGNTLIGMHLKRVAVPVRLSVSRIGEAPLVCAKTRPKYIGGPRAVYEK